jgi:hypothetical protein
MKRNRCKVKEALGLISIRLGVVAAAASSLFGLSGTAGAFDIPTGNEDVELRWDNTVRYTLADRLKGQNSSIINSKNINDGDRNFDVGIVSNRLDILSESDIVYKKDFGVRLSGALWYDQTYNDSLDNTSAATSNHLVNGVPTPGFSSNADRYYAGPSGELLDAFAFGKFTIADIPINVKAGRHTVVWGESMFSNGGTHGISYGQSAIDVSKALAQPGVEIKELYRPRNQVSMQAQPTKELSIAAQYYLQWEANRMPDPGTYLSFADVLGNGSESLYAGPPTHPRALNGGDIEPDQAGDWGIATRWSPSWLEGTVGLYYRKFSDVSGQLHLNLGRVPFPGPPGSTGIAPTYYHWAYASDIDLYGISLNQQLGGISIGSELSYRKNMPLWSNAATIAPGGTLPGSGDTFGARGDTWHALVNFMNILSKSPLYDSATAIAEFTWNRLDHVTQRPDLFKGSSSYSGIDKVTKDYVGGQILFSPTWFQVISGVDLSMPMSGGMGLVGNSAVTNGGNKNSGSYSVGFSADIFQRYKASLAYAGFFGSLGSDPANPGQYIGNGSQAALRDRDMITLTLKTTF